MELRLAGLRALVCGGSQGLGAATARSLAAEGARVAITARDGDKLNTEAADYGALPVPADLSSPDGPAIAIEAAADALGGLDVIVVNSGGPPAGTFENLTDADWRTAVDGTLLSAIRLIGAALPHLRESEAPAILIVLSSSVRQPIEGLTTSNVLRPALNGLIKSLVTEIAPVRILGVAPGRFDTRRVRDLDALRATRAGVDARDVAAESTSRIPLGRYGKPEEFGRTMAVLASPEFSYLNGTVVQVDGGLVRALP